MEITQDHAQYFTATVNNWKHVLQSDTTKQIIVDSLSFLHHQHRAFIYGFVIMSNHIHLIWQIRDGHILKDVQRDFLKFTAQKIKFFLKESNPELLAELEVNLADRKYQIWKRNPLNVPLYSPEVFQQKLEYIHYNPVKAELCQYPDEYHYSSARFYLKDDPSFDFLRHHNG